MAEVSVAKPAVVEQEAFPPSGAFDRVWIWGLPLARLDSCGVLDQVDRLVVSGKPDYFITANLQYAMLTDRDPRLATVNARAAFLLADGMPMVWYSRLQGRPLPERVAGADLIGLLCRRASERGYPVFFLGGGPGVAEAAVAELSRRYPSLQVAGIEAPAMESLSAEGHAALAARVRRSGARLLFAALGQPKGELWLAEHCEAMNVPACVQVGASFDFLAGRVCRAPMWVRRLGLEWAYRMAGDPRRLTPRYFRNALFLAKAVLRDAATALRQPAGSWSSSASATSDRRSDSPEGPPSRADGPPGGAP